MRLSVCHVASELAPLAKSGGLADMVGALTAHLARAGHDVRVFLPRYGHMDLSGREVHPVEFLQDLELALGGHRFPFSISTTKIPGTDSFGLYLVDCPPLYHRRGIYDFAGDEHLRFALLGKAAIESCQRMAWGPQVFHLHDWHTGLVPLWLSALYDWDELFAASRTLLTIHNLGYQGAFPAHLLHDLDLAPHAHRLPREDLDAGVVNFLKLGLLHADRLSTVSPTYAREIQTPEMGFGLDGLLSHRTGDLSGIVNGVDYGEWNPGTDPRLPHHYSARGLAGKERCKRALCERVSLPYRKGLPLLGVVSRLVHQKGFHLVHEPLSEVLGRGEAQLVALGTGEERYEAMFRDLEHRFPDAARYVPAYDEEAAHWIEAGADAFLMPSLYEPCGLNQMYSMRYGTLPVVRKTGGLADTVRPWDPDTGSGTGFVFEHADVQGFRWALGQALDTYRDHPAGWRKLQKNAMAEDFSWDRQGALYVELYRSLTP